MPLDTGLLGINQQQQQGGGNDIFSKLLDARQSQQRNDIESRRLSLYDKELQSRQKQAEDVSRGRDDVRDIATMKLLPPTSPEYKRSLQQFIARGGGDASGITLPDQEVHKEIMDATNRGMKIVADLKSGKITSQQAAENIGLIRHDLVDRIGGYNGLGTDAQDEMLKPFEDVNKGLTTGIDQAGDIYAHNKEAWDSQAAQTSGSKARADYQLGLKRTFATEEQGRALERIRESHASGGGGKKEDTTKLLDQFGLHPDFSANGAVDDELGTVKDRGKFSQNVQPFLRRLADLNAQGALNAQDSVAVLGEAARASGLTVSTDAQGRLFVGDKETTKLLTEMWNAMGRDSSAQASGAPGLYSGK